MKTNKKMYKQTDKQINFEFVSVQGKLEHKKTGTTSFWKVRIKYCIHVANEILRTDIY